MALTKKEWFNLTSKILLWGLCVYFWIVQMYSFAFVLTITWIIDLYVIYKDYKEYKLSLGNLEREKNGKIGKN